MPASDGTPTEREYLEGLRYEDKMTSSTPPAESELRFQIMDYLDDHDGDCNADLAEGILELVTAHLEAAVRSAEIKEAQRLAQKCINHTELFYDGDCYTYKAVRVGQITHELNNRLAQLRRAPATGSNQGADHEV